MGAKLILLRHGQIKANVDGRWHGSTDSSLTWTGRRQAKRTGTWLAATNAGITYAYTSPLLRCQKTAEFATRKLDVPIEIVDGLAEMSIGDWENESFKALTSDYKLFQEFDKDANWAPPNGESLRAVEQRMSAALTRISELHNEDETILVVSHGVAISIALAHFLDNDCYKWKNYRIHNCSLTELLLEPEPLLVGYNEHAHL